MATHLVTLSNWNDASFWSGLTVLPGDTLDLSALGSAFTLTFDHSTNRIVISDGATPFSIGGASNGAEDAQLGGGEIADLDHIIGPDGASSVDFDGDSESFSGGSGSDKVSGGAGSDTLSGGAGDDNLDGGSDNDTIDGGTGDDSLTGGGGDDVFVYEAGDGADTITDFNITLVGVSGYDVGENNDSIDLSSFYDNISELREDFDDDGVLNQSNSTLSGGTVDYSNNDQFGSGGGLTFENTTGSDTFTAANTGVVCFTTGTLIATPSGELPIESLRSGDPVLTRDNGPQPLIWIATRTIGHAELQARPELKPIVIAPALVGAHAPLRVSPQHGMLMRLEGEQKLIRARHLARMNGGQARLAVGCRSVTYCHLMFEAHQIVFANGAPAESFYPGQQAIRSLPCPARRELVSHFPALAKHAPEVAFGARAREFMRWNSLPPTLGALLVA